MVETSDLFRSDPIARHRGVDHSTGLHQINSRFTQRNHVLRSTLAAPETSTGHPDQTAVSENAQASPQSIWIPLMQNGQLRNIQYPVFRN